MPNRHPTPTPEYPIGSLRRSSRFLGGEKITNDDDGVVVLSKETISGVGAGSLDFLRNNPDPVLQELVKLYPGHLRVIEEHYSEFLQLINEPMDGLKDPKQEVQAQAVEAEPKAKDKDIPYVQDEEVEHTEKRHLNVVFMGHVGNKD